MTKSNDELLPPLSNIPSTPRATPATPKAKPKKQGAAKKPSKKAPAKKSPAKKAPAKSKAKGKVERTEPTGDFREGSIQADIWSKLKLKEGLTEDQVDKIVAKKSRNKKGWAGMTAWTLTKMARRMGKTLVREDGRFYAR